MYCNSVQIYHLLSLGLNTEFPKVTTLETTVVYRNVNPCRYTNLNNIVSIIVYKGSHAN